MPPRRTAGRRAAVVVASVLVLSGCQADGDPPAQSAQSQDSDEVAEEPGTASPALPPDDGVADELPQPEWAGPPDNVIGATAALDPLVFEGDGVAVALTGMTVYPSGAELRVTVRRRPDMVDRDPARGAPPPIEDPMRVIPGASPGQGADDELPADLLRLVVRYPDGQVADTAESGAGTGRADESPESPRLSPITSMGTPDRQDYALWLWPLPGPGSQALEVVVQWPAEGIQRTEAGIDLEFITAAADRAIELWEAP